MIDRCAGADMPCVRPCVRTNDGTVIVGIVGWQRTPTAEYQALSALLCAQETGTMPSTPSDDSSSFGPAADKCATRILPNAHIDWPFDFLRGCCGGTGRTRSRSTSRYAISPPAMSRQAPDALDEAKLPVGLGLNGLDNFLCGGHETRGAKKKQAKNSDGVVRMAC